MEITNLHFNEDDLLHMLVAVERYMSEHNSCSERVREAHKVFNEIWLKLNTDQEYYLAEY